MLTFLGGGAVVLGSTLGLWATQLLVPGHPSSGEHGSLLEHSAQVRPVIVWPPP